MHPMPGYGLSLLLLLKKALETAPSALSGTITPTQEAPLGFLFSVTGKGTNGLHHSAPSPIQRPFGLVSFATLHLVRHLLDGNYPR